MFKSMTLHNFVSYYSRKANFPDFFPQSIDVNIFVSRNISPKSNENPGFPCTEFSNLVCFRS